MHGKYTAIPRIFYDTVEEEPIKECKRCGKDLLGTGELYVIEKQFRRREVIFEHAICMECTEKMRMDLSKESLENLEKYMLERASLQERMHKLQDKEYTDEDWLGTCLITGERLDDQEEYQIQGMFMGDRMLTQQFPYMIGGKALEEMQELLSKETRDELERIKNDLINVPPELEYLFKPKYVPI